MLLVDGRWRGRNGIARFAQEVIDRIDCPVYVPNRLRPLHPCDAAWLAYITQQWQPAVYFTPGFNPPLYATCPVVFVIHDLIHLHFGPETSAAKRLYYESVVKRAARRAAFVLTVSETSKAEIVDWAKIPVDRVRVVGNGVSGSFFPNGPRYAADRPYLLFVGNRKPHKNLPRVLQAFARSTLARSAGLYLTGGEDPATRRLADELGIGARIRFLGVVPDPELAALYRGALGLVTPSLYEGFGLPAIEAAACGCPVIAAASGAQAEVLGGAALLVDPASVDTIANAMDSLADPDVRTAMTQRGLERASLFTWDKTGAAVAAALRDAMRERRSMR